MISYVDLCIIITYSFLIFYKNPNKEAMMFAVHTIFISLLVILCKTMTKKEEHFI